MNHFKSFMVLITEFLIVSTFIISTEGNIYLNQQTLAESQVEITGIGSKFGSFQLQVRRGSVIKVTVYIKNTADQARTFYVGASIIGEGETTWKDLPGWGTTPIVNPDEISAFDFDDYTIPSSAYLGYHGIVVKVWADSSKTTQFGERWFPQVVLVGALQTGCVAFSFDFESDNESDKSAGHVSPSTLSIMSSILNLLHENEIPATIFVQGACLNNPQTGNDFKKVIDSAASQGFEIASHSYFHPSDINSLAESAIENEIVTTESLLEELVGIKPTGFRAPHFACGERLWKVLAEKGYIYDSSAWQSEPVPYTIQTPSRALIEVPWKHQDGDTSYSEFMESINYAANYGKYRIVVFHPQNVKEHWDEFQQLIGLVSGLKSEGKIEAVSISQLTKVASPLQINIERFICPSGVFKSGDVLSFDLVIKNTGDVDGWIWPIALIIGPTPLGQSTYMIEVPREQVFIRGGESLIASIKWTIPSDAPVGTYDAIVWVYDRPPSDASARMLDRDDRDFAFMIDKGISYIQIEAIHPPWGEQRAIHIHIAKEDQVRSGTFTFKTLALLLKLASIVTGWRIKDAPKWLKLLGDGINLIWAAEKLESLEPGKRSVDFLMLQVIGEAGYLYEASLMDIGKTKVPITLTGIPKEYLNIPIPNHVVLKFRELRITKLSPNGGTYQRGDSISIKVEVMDDLNNSVSGANVVANITAPLFMEQKVELAESDEGKYHNSWFISDDTPFGTYTIFIFAEKEGYFSVSTADSFNLIVESIGASVTVTSKISAEGGEVEITSKKEVYSPEVNVETEASVGRIVVKVSSDVPEGKTIIINIDNDTLPISELNELLVLYDGKEISLANDYADVLNPNDEDVPEYLVLMGAERIQVLVSIPYFSIHTITVTRRTAAPTVLDRFNQIVWGIPIIGDIGKLLDAVVPGYGSVLFVVITLGFLISIVAVWKRQKRKL